MEQLYKNFQSRDALIKYVKSLSKWAEGSESCIIGGTEKAYKTLRKIDTLSY